MGRPTLSTSRTEATPGGEAISSPATTPRWRRLSSWIVVYGVALALIAFWPQHVDSGAGPFLRWVTTHFPLLTYQRIEFGSNVLLFVPLGVGLTLLLPRLRYLVMPIALLTTVTIESVQALFLGGRTASVLDVIANLTGAALGQVGLLVVQEVIRRRRARELSDPS